MPEIGIATLVLAIEAIGEQLHEVRQVMDDGAATAEDLQRLADLGQAAAELAREYDKARRDMPGLPAYDELAGR